MRQHEAIIRAAIRASGRVLQLPPIHDEAITSAMIAAIEAQAFVSEIKPMQRWELQKLPPPSPRRWQR
jgi:hypothetical protein